jgi:hypothetical protein
MSQSLRHPMNVLQQQLRLKRRSIVRHCERSEAIHLSTPG